MDTLIKRFSASLAKVSIAVFLITSVIGIFHNNAAALLGAVCPTADPASGYTGNKCADNSDCNPKGKGAADPKYACFTISNETTKKQKCGCIDKKLGKDLSTASLINQPLGGTDVVVYTNQDPDVFIANQQKGITSVAE